MSSARLIQLKQGMDVLLPDGREGIIVDMPEEWDEDVPAGFIFAVAKEDIEKVCITIDRGSITVLE